eukprot:Partr_v1_DN27247_c2_g1_i3_m38788 putative Intraflagellar transport 57 homolog (Chlamydomonas)
MNEVVDKLLLLDYDRSFCRPHRLKKLSRSYFDLPSPKSAGDQFFYFSSLMCWLLSRCTGNQLPKPGQFDDPSIVIGTIGSALKALDMSLEGAAMKLRQPYGPEIVKLLNSVLDVVLTKSPSLIPSTTFSPPVSTLSSQQQSVEIRHVKNVVVDASDGEEDEIEDDLPEDMPSSGDAVPATVTAASVVVNDRQWKVEVERVAPFLKVTLGADNKDWRIHLQQVQSLSSSITLTAEALKPKLLKCIAQVDSSMEKINSREKYVNAQLEQFIEQYRSADKRLQMLKQQLSADNESVNDLASEMARVTEDLESVQAQMDDLGNGMTDPKPLIVIKQSKAQLESEVREIHAKISVLRSEVLRQQANSRVQAASKLSQSSSNKR